ncbi:MAG: RNA polymerase factor sigma-54 [Rhizobiales bacterium]|nr:RNA polymerase factor sigma-54 [Hyphomicrobiales bacterium]OJY41135.1 MAG: RNA polymerase sigma-54 factor [Rhizobiales bacterium 64-17]
MALSQRLEFRQTQALVMTPQLMQAIKLLQLSSLDLAAYVEAELEKNPLLERASDGEAPTVADDAPVAAGGDAAEGDWAADELETSRSDMEAGLGTELENVFPDDDGARAPAAQTSQSAPDADAPANYSEWSASGAAAPADGDYNPEAFVSATATLADHLAEQLVLAEHDPVRRMIGQYLIDLVDEAGYLAGDLDAVADKLGASRADIESVLSVIQGFDPVGVAARDLRECLAIQLRERDRLDPAMQALLDNLDLLAKRDLPGLRRRCGVDDEDLADMIVELRQLNPKPGLAFGSTAVQPIVPDVFVRAAPDGSWQVELNTDTLPKVLVAQRYYAQVSKTARNDKDKTYLADCLQTATWLVRALDQRARTILKVASEIVRQQDAFFVHGVNHLRPLNLKIVAEAIGMHESTVSRVTANKYMATSRGIFELKYFFTAAIAATDGGEAHSAEAVRHRIKQLIDAEAATDILSDDTLVERLKEAGIDIARRTVAKYREALHIPSSVQRRREKQAALRA